MRGRTNGNSRAAEFTTVNEQRSNFPFVRPRAKAALPKSKKKGLLAAALDLSLTRKLLIWRLVRSSSAVSASAVLVV